MLIYWIFQLGNLLSRIFHETKSKTDPEKLYEDSRVNWIKDKTKAAFKNIDRKPNF
jgi:hypothetical protein